LQSELGVPLTKHELVVFQGIYDTLKTCANISKSAGGIGLAIHCIRAAGSYIAGVRMCSRLFILQ